MKVLDLTFQNASYQVIRYPDGQQDIVLKDSGKKVMIKSRMRNFQDLELIACAVNALRRQGTKKIELYIPYLLGGRSDRQFQPGGTSYLAGVVAPFLNSLKLDKIITMDAHSAVADAAIHNLKNIDNYKLVKMAMKDLYGKEQPHCIIVSPDQGASKKIDTLVKSLELKCPVIQAEKHRDLNGNITGTKVNLFEREDHRYDYVIIDDLCDGGRTFVNIAEKISDFHLGADHRNVYLIVTHGIFSNGFEQLGTFFDKIYCTDSYDVVVNDLVKQYPIF